MPRFAALVVWFCFGLSWSERGVQTVRHEIHAHSSLNVSETRTSRWAASGRVLSNPGVNQGLKGHSSWSHARNL